MKSKLYGTRLYINCDSLKNNINFFKSLVPDAKIIAMVKANAYGYGDIPMAKELNKLGVNCFGVADFEEGIRLREHNIKGKIMVMNPGLNNLEMILYHKLEPVIYNWEMLFKLSKILSTQKSWDHVSDIHIKLNSGMNRWGFDLISITELISELKKIPKIKIQSIYSHLSSSKNILDDSFTKNQINQFLQALNLFNKNFKYKIDSHILNSSATLRKFDDGSCNYVRLGIALYGGVPFIGLKPVAELKCPISDIRTVLPGESVGYGRNPIATEKIKIGIIPFGYADGLQRHWGHGKLKFFYNNQLLPTIGDISMDSCMINISSVDNIAIGDEVFYFGQERTIWDLAQELDTISYEISATLSRRIKRIYY